MCDVCLSGGGAGSEQETDDHRLPAEEVGAEQETPGDHQQEAAGLCTGTTSTLTHVSEVLCVECGPYSFIRFLKDEVVFCVLVLVLVSSRRAER